MEQFKEKPEDWLPDGQEKQDYLKEDKEWLGLEGRLGKPRILENVYFPEVIDWVKKEFRDNPEQFSFFEAGVGHGNDIRVMRKLLDGLGRYLGVDTSRAEIDHGFDFYREKDGEDNEKTRKLFALGDLRDLKKLRARDSKKGDYSVATGIKDGEFALVYMEAVLHALGYGKRIYREKKEEAQKMINELFRICQPGGRFFGRTSVFRHTITKEQQFRLLRETNNWRFIPEKDELKEMLKQAGFINVKTVTQPHEKAKLDPNKKDILRLSFLVEKLKGD